MTETKKKPHQMPFFVRQAGLDYGKSEEQGAIVGFADESAAKEDAAARNGKALEMGVKARYEFVPTGL